MGTPPSAQHRGNPLTVLVTVTLGAGTSSQMPRIWFFGARVVPEELASQGLFCQLVTGV